MKKNEKKKKEDIPRRVPFVVPLLTIISFPYALLFLYFLPKSAAVRMFCNLFECFWIHKDISRKKRVVHVVFSSCFVCTTPPPKQTKTQREREIKIYIYIYMRGLFIVFEGGIYFSLRMNVYFIYM